MRCLITAIGSISAEAVIAGTFRYPEAHVVGCNMHPAKWTAASRLVHVYYQVAPARDRNAYLQDLRDICRREKITHLIPLTDVEVDAISMNRMLFKNEGTLPCISPPSAIDGARDKFALHQRYFADPEIDTIPTIEVEDVRPDWCPFPMLAKPRRGRSSEGHITIADAAELEFWKPRIVDRDYVIQPYISGEVVVVDVVREPSSGACVSVARRELLRTPNGAGISVEVLPRHPCNPRAESIAADLDLHGCVNMEFLVSNEKFYLMDINPRFSAGVAFSVASGYDMIVNHLRCFDGKNLAPLGRIANNFYSRSFIEHSFERDYP